MAEEFEGVPLTELAIEISVCVDGLYLDHKLAERPDDQFVPANGTSYQRVCACPDKSVLLVLDI